MPPNNQLIVPTVLVSGSLHFAEVDNNGRAQNVVDVLLATEGVKEEILGGVLEESGWALQRIRTEESGRSWEEDELEALDDGQYIHSFIPYCGVYAFFYHRSPRVVHTYSSAG